MTNTHPTHKNVFQLCFFCFFVHLSLKPEMLEVSLNNILIKVCISLHNIIYLTCLVERIDIFSIPSHSLLQCASQSGKHLFRSTYGAVKSTKCCYETEQTPYQIFGLIFYFYFFAAADRP